MILFAYRVKRYSKLSDNSEGKAGADGRCYRARQSVKLQMNHGNDMPGASSGTRAPSPGAEDPTAEPVGDAWGVTGV